MSSQEIKIHRINQNRISDISNVLHHNYNSKEVEYFYKHFQWVFKNPQHHIVGALFKEELVAIRPGMGWNIYFGNTNINAIQLTGTVVSERYRRRGLFLKTNLSFIDLVKNDFEFIFNVSVDISRAGYEKLGWKYLKGFHRLTKINLKNFLINELEPSGAINLSLSDLELENILASRNSCFNDVFYTKYSISFLKWRMSNQKSNYYYYSKNEIGFVIYTVQQKFNKKEITIGEIFLNEKSYKSFKKLLNGVLTMEKPFFSTVYISKSHPLFNYYLRYRFIPNFMKYNLNFGVKRLNHMGSSDIFDRNKWALSSIDLDTF
jgi:hypothetical protein